ncbi:hypothetical protein HMPREF1432_01502 [Helicobacter pylori GAMchJs114i]|nr:hypothetical protein HMPREF1432_01502 [Helicobacter pylori GAMchJs114i]
MKNFFQASGFNQNPLAFLILINGIPIAKSKKHSKRFLIQISKLDCNQAIAFQDLIQKALVGF